MGLRFRKNIKVAPGVKLNLNKNSASVTVGTKEAHYTVNSNGKKTASAGIAGTGLSYVSTIGDGKKKEAKTNKKTASKTTPTTKTTPSKGSPKKKETKTLKKSSKAQPKKKGGCLGSILLVFTIICLIFAIVPSDDKKEDTSKPNQQNIADEQTTENTVSQSDDIEAELIAQEQAEAERITQEQSQAAQAVDQSQNSANNFNTYDNASQQQKTSNFVLNTSTMKFHNPGCKDVKKIAPQNYSTYDGSRDDVMNQGYSPCGHCNP